MADYPSFHQDEYLSPSGQTQPGLSELVVKLIGKITDMPASPQIVVAGPAQASADPGPVYLASGQTLNVRVMNPQPLSGQTQAPAMVTFPDTQKINAEQLPLPTGAASEATLATLTQKLPTTGPAPGAACWPVVLATDQPPLGVELVSPLTLEVSNFPSQQGVRVENFPTGYTVSVANLPATQPVEVGNWPTGTTINNFPPVQPVVFLTGQTVSIGNFPSGQTVSVANFPPATSISNFPTGYTVSVSNFPSGQTVNVGNYPASTQVSNWPTGYTITNFPVSTTVSNFPTGTTVTNFPASTAVSNFPTGTTVTNFPASTQVSNFPVSTQVSNFPTNQAVTVSNASLAVTLAGSPLTVPTTGSATVEALSAKTQSGAGAAQTNLYYRGAYFFLTVSAVAGSLPVLVVKVQTQDPVSGSWVDVPNASSASISSAGTALLVLKDGVASIANVGASFPLPRTYRFAWTITGTNPSFTFSIGAQFLV